MAQNDKKLTCYISGTIHHMMFIYSAHVEKDNISRHLKFLSLFQILIFMVSSGVKGQKMPQNDKKLCLSHSISQEAYIM